MDMNFFRVIFATESTKTQAINELSPKYLDKIKKEWAKGKYSRYLNIMNDWIKAIIISNAEKGIERNPQLEDKLRLIEKEIESNKKF